MILRRVLLGVAVFTLTISLTLGYATGAPDQPSVCSQMMPSHVVSEQSTPAPYSITFSPNTYTPGGPPINVTIQANTGTNFRGFVLTARYSQPCQNQTSNNGTFIQAANTKIICSNQAITHASSTPKTNITVQWTPPATTRGPLEFRATVVQVKSIFWINVKSSVINDSNGQSCPSTTQPPTSPAVPTTDKSLDAVSTITNPVKTSPAVPTTDKSLDAVSTITNPVTTSPAVPTTDKSLDAVSTITNPVTTQVSTCLLCLFCLLLYRQVYLRQC